MPYESAFSGSRTTTGFSPSTSGGGLDIDRILAQQARQQQENPSILGLLGNAWEGVAGLAKGLGSGLAATYHDVTQGIGDIADLDIGEADYRTDDILKGMLGVDPRGSIADPADWHPLAPSSVAGSIWHRWQPFLPHGDPASEGWENLYEDPIGALLDIASIASLGTIGAAGKAGSVLRAAEGTAAGTRAAGLVDDALRAMSETKAAGIGTATPRAMRAAALREGLEALGKGNTLTARMLPKPVMTLRQGAGGIDNTGLFKTAEMYNPLWRGASKLAKYPMTRRVDDLTTEATALKNETVGIDTAAFSEPLVMKAALLEKTASVLKQQPFSQRIESGRYATRLTKLDDMKRGLVERESFFRERDEAMRASIASMEANKRQLQAITPDYERYMDNAALGRLRYNIEGVEQPAWVKGPQPTPLTEGPTITFRGGEVAGGGVATVTRVREASPIALQRMQAEPGTIPILDRVRAQQGELDSYIEFKRANADELLAQGQDVPHLIEGAERMKRMLDDDLTKLLDPTEGDPQLIEMRNIAQRRLEDIEQMSANGWAGATMEPEFVLQRYYEGMLWKHGADIDAKGNLTSPVDWRDIDDWFHESGDTAPVYFPFQDPTKLGSRGLFMSKRPIGANIYARDPHNKMLQGVLLKKGKWNNDPIETAQRRAAFHVSETATLNAWSDRIRRVGLRVDAPESVPDGYVLAAPDILRVNHTIRSRFRKSLDEGLNKGVDPDSALAKALKDALDGAHDDIARLGQAGKMEMYAVPQVVMDNLNSAAKYAQVFGGKGVQLWYDSAMNVWRGLALTASPRWVLNNVLGNVAFSIMQGAKLRDMIRIYTEKQRSVLTSWAGNKEGAGWQALSGTLGGPELRRSSLAAQVQRLPIERLGHGYVGNVLEQRKAHLPVGAEDLIGGKTIARMRERFAGSRWERSGQAMKTLNGILEDAAREASFLTAAEKQIARGTVQRTAWSFGRAASRIDRILESGFDMATPNGAARVASALDEVGHFFGNYGRMTPFERHVIRRWIFPFWGFYRHSTKLMLMFPFEYPGKAHILESLENVTQDMLEEYGPIPEWMRSPMPIGPPGGPTAILSGAGANPFAGPAEGVAGLGQMLSPVIKTGLEQSFGRNVFTGQEFTDRDVFTPYGSDQAYDINTLQPVDKVAPGVLQMLFQQVPQFDMLRDLIAGGPTYDTASIADAIQQRMGDVGEASPPSETGAPYYDVTAADQLAKMFGLNVFSYDLPAFAERQEQDQMAVFNELLRRQALGAA